MEKKIENIEIQYLQISDYEELKQVMIESYTSLKDAYWNKEQIQTLIKNKSAGINFT